MGTSRSCPLGSRLSQSKWYAGAGSATDFGQNAIGRMTDSNVPRWHPTAPQLDPSLVLGHRLHGVSALHCMGLVDFFKEVEISSVLSSLS